MKRATKEIKLEMVSWLSIDRHDPRR